jgi:hypothetical protein
MARPGRAVAAVDPRDDPMGVAAAERVMLELWTILAGFPDALTNGFDSQ